MKTIHSSVSDIFLDKVAEWLTQAALTGENLENIVRGFCERIAATGMPIARVHLTFSMLHPLYDALGFTWKRSSGLVIEGYRHGAEKPERFLQSPYYHLLTSNLEHLRRRIDKDGPLEFPIFDELRSEAITDYIAFVQTFGDGSAQGMMGSRCSASSPTIC
jgi:adenylate cyclase